MIPDMPALEQTADGVLRSIPPGLTRGEVAAGLYGLGFLGRWALPRLRAQGVRLVSCHDAKPMNSASAGGLPVHAASDLDATRPEFMIVTARHAVVPVSDALAERNIPHVSYDAWYAAAHLSAFRGLHDHELADPRSKEVLRAVLMAMLTGEPAHCAAVSEPDQYFCLPRFREAESEIYVDAGAFDGDSVENFIAAHRGRFSKIHAFEPGPEQFAALKSRAGRLAAEWKFEPGRIALINAGLGEADARAHAGSGNGQLTSFAIGHSAPDGVAVDVVSLDSYLKGERITFLKADVEGMEMALLRGAQSTIRRHEPKISICVYHYPADIPEIANYLGELVPDYRFALRHHAPQLMETVLYCWTD